MPPGANNIVHVPPRRYVAETSKAILHSPRSYILLHLAGLHIKAHVLQKETMLKDQTNLTSKPFASHNSDIKFIEVQQHRAKDPDKICLDTKHLRILDFVTK